MPVWTPKQIWQGADVFIIGGGPSLRDFHWGHIRGELTIGCNTAFTLGPEVCKVCVFGDESWFNHFKSQLTSYVGEGGVVFTNVQRLYKCREPSWLWTMQRQVRGMHTTALGWNGNTGAVAINLAILFGAKRIFLLGFDMHRINDKPNWHEHVIRPKATRPHVYLQFAREFKAVARAWREKFSDVEIVNVTDDSGLGPEIFPWVGVDEFWANRCTEQMRFEKVEQEIV